MDHVDQDEGELLDRIAYKDEIQRQELQLRREDEVDENTFAYSDPRFNQGPSKPANRPKNPPKKGASRRKQDNRAESNAPLRNLNNNINPNFQREIEEIDPTLNLEYSQDFSRRIREKYPLEPVIGENYQYEDPELRTRLQYAQKRFSNIIHELKEDPLRCGIVSHHLMNPRPIGEAKTIFVQKLIDAINTYPYRNNVEH